MRRQRTVAREDRPSVLAHTHLRASGSHHRLDGQNHALLEQRALARRSIVGHLRVLVHAPADTVPDQRADHGQPGALGRLLDGAGDIAHAGTRDALSDARQQRGFGAGEEVLRLRGDLVNSEGPRRIGHPALERDADVDRDNVVAFQAVGPRDAVHDHVVGGRADRAREASVALERGHATASTDEALGDAVELGGADARAYMPLELRQGRDQDVAGTRHGVDLGRGHQRPRPIENARMDAA